ncbi:UNVERIFIED_CONTAM: hypothetical protein FKN15_013769 [Acipenser sinensis]
MLFRFLLAFSVSSLYLSGIDVFRNPLAQRVRLINRYTCEVVQHEADESVISPPLSE